MERDWSTVRIYVWKTMLSLYIYIELKILGRELSVYREGGYPFQTKVHFIICQS